MAAPANFNATTSATPTPANPCPDQNEAEKLLPLSAADFRIFNSLADRMDLFHNHFRRSWQELSTLISSDRGSVSQSRILTVGLQFCYHLSVHHSIEEDHIFPVLAARMPPFATAGYLVAEHGNIHRGLDELQEYLERCRRGTEKDGLKVEEVKRMMNSFGQALFAHLDDEVKELGAEKMRSVWSKEEIREIPF